MTIATTYQSYASTWQIGNTGAGAFTYGRPFRVSAECAATQIMWHRPSTTGAVPISLRLYDDSTQTVLAQAPVVPTSAGAGWKVYTFPSPIALHTGRQYMVTAGYNAGGTEAYDDGTDNPTLPSVFTATTFTDYWANGSNTYPTTGRTSFIHGLDVQIDDSITGAEPPPITTGDIGGELDDWLSATPEVQTHETDGLPWLTKVVADLTKNAVDASKIVIDATKDIVDNIPQASDAPWVKVQKLWEIAGSLTEAEIGLWNLFAKRAPGQLTGDTPGGGSAFYAGDGRQVAQTAADNQDLLNALTASVTALQGQVWGLGQPLAGFPSEFELLDTLEFVECAAWVQEADVYVMHITTVPSSFAFDDVCGVAMVGKAGWWAVLQDTLVAERHFADFEFNLLYHPAGRMNGVLVELKRGGAGTIQAWRRLPPPAGPGGVHLPPPR